MGRPKKSPTLNDQLRSLIALALAECKNTLAKELIDILDRQQVSDAADQLTEMGKREEK